MPDPRFFEELGPVALSELAELAGAQLADPSAGGRMIRSVAILSRAAPDTATFLIDRRNAEGLQGLKAAACFVSVKDVDALPPGCAALVTPAPHAAYAVAALRLHRQRSFAEVAIAPDARLEPGVRLAPGVVIGPGAQIGEGTEIGAGTVIGPGVAIGRDCRISTNVSIGCALIGDRVKILAGAVIGEAGFGATAGPGGVIDIPQLGRVLIQDGVTIGANSCIDRGAFDDTVIGENTKIDNLVQIAHNVRLGRNCVMAAQSGIAGSCTVGDGVQFGGGVGIADHLEIGAGARIAAAAGLMHNVPAGQTWGGIPARPIRQWMRETAWLTKHAATRKGGDE
jgi:UDP-3-O-[3-hydroxymyristoyl] glucosamine N-acyltransferase